MYSRVGMCVYIYMITSFRRGYKYIYRYIDRHIATNMYMYIYIYIYNIDIK